MATEGEGSDKPSFLMVVLLACAALLVIILAAVMIVSWRSHKRNTPPYNKHPVAAVQPAPSLSRRG